MGVAVNRTLGLVVAGNDGQHELRYAILGRGCSPAAFGHAGAHAQVAWADPATSPQSRASVHIGADGNTITNLI
jgi:hypothetical protein